MDIIETCVKCHCIISKKEFMKGEGMPIFAQGMCEACKLKKISSETLHRSFDF